MGCILQPLSVQEGEQEVIDLGLVHLVLVLEVLSNVVFFPLGNLQLQLEVVLLASLPFNSEITANFFPGLLVILRPLFLMDLMADVLVVSNMVYFAHDLREEHLFRNKADNHDPESNQGALQTTHVSQKCEDICHLAIV